MLALQSLKWVDFFFWPWIANQEQEDIAFSFFACLDCPGVVIGNLIPLH